LQHECIVDPTRPSQAISKNVGERGALLRLVQTLQPAPRDVQVTDVGERLGNAVDDRGIFEPEFNVQIELVECVHAEDGLDKVGVTG